MRFNFIERKYVVLTVLFIAWLLGVFDKVAINVAVIPISNEFGLVPAEIGMIISVFALGGVSMNLFGGFLADKFKSENILLVAMALWSLFTGLTGAAFSLTSLMAIRYFFGASEGIFPPASSVTVAEWFKRDEIATAKAALLSCSHLGNAFGVFAIGFLVYYFNWRVSFFILGTLGIIVMFWFMYVSRSQEGKTRIGGGQANPNAEKKKKVPLRDIFKNSIAWKAPVIQFGGGFFLWGLNAWLPQYWVKVKGLNLKQMGTYSIIPSMISFFVMIIIGWLMDKHFEGRERILLVFSLVISGISIYMMYNADSIVAGFIWQSVTSLGMGIAAPVVYALVLKYVKRELIGTVSGMTAFGTAFAGVIAPTVMGFLIQKFEGSYGPIFALLIVILAICAVVAATIKTEKQAA